MYPYHCFWCPAFSNHALSWLTIMPETQQHYYFDYLLSLPFKGSCRTSGIYFR